MNWRVKLNREEILQKQRESAYKLMKGENSYFHLLRNNGYEYYSDGKLMGFEPIDMRYAIGMTQAEFIQELKLENTIFGGAGWP